MNRLTHLANLYNSDPSFTKKKTGNVAFIAGFMAARRLCAVMGKIAQLEGKDAQVEILRVGTEEVDNQNPNGLPPELSDVIIDTLN